VHLAAMNGTQLNSSAFLTMSLIRKQHSEIAKEGARTGMVQGLRKQYDAVVREKLPNTITALVALYESVESVARIKNRLERLRQGPKQKDKSP
jgi:hypothetical protein